MKYRFILGLIFVYFVLHLTNLTLLPLFNDEAIYLDWGWNHTHMSGHLYDALLDAKQPLMIWIFGFFENFFTDPLFAGRFASVLIGSLTLVGIYKTTKKLFAEKVAIVAGLLYSIIPIFLFYNRQALLEAGVACVGVWSFYSLLNLLRHPTARNGIILGSILGIGFFIKSSSLLFIVSASVLILWYVVKHKNVSLLKSYCFAILTFFGVDFFLFINPLFWQTFSSNSRYSYTLAEFFTFPFSAWISHLIGFFEIGFFFITPFVFVSAFVGMFLMRKNKIKDHHPFIFYFVLALLLEIFSAKFQGQRYLFTFLPFLIISAAYVFILLWEGALWKKLTVIVSFIPPLVLSFMILFSPKDYILDLSKVTNYSDVGYVLGQTSGYGIGEAMNYIKEHSSPALPTMIVFGLNIGNPESAVDIYSQKNPQLFALHIDANFFPGIDQYKCLSSKYPIFLVARNAELLGMERYFSLEKEFINPDNTYSIRLYTLKKNCTGKTLSLSDIYQESINKIMFMRSGGIQ